MESTQDRQLRLRMILGKYRVTERSGPILKVALGGSTIMTWFDTPDVADVKAGDWITLYTGVYYANPQPTSVQ